MYGQKLRELVEECPMDNLASALYHGKVDGESLNPLQYNYFFLILMVAGNETTRTLTSNGMRLLMEHPQQYQQLVDNPELLEGAIEEFLRYDPAVIAFRRTAMKDVEVGGQLIRKGDKIEMFYAAANADEAVFSDGDTFDITRAQREDVKNNHRAFGVGEHFCMGSHLARLELKVIFEEILLHIRNPRLTGEINWLRSNFIHGIKKMPIEFDVV